METPEIPASSAMRFRVKLRTRWSDEDNQRVLNNAVYMTLFEETRFAYFTSLGLLAENQFPFLLAQTNVVFLSPGRGGAEVEAEAATVHLGTSSFTQAY
jgi:acyl-CoA thioester hydrolase